VAESPTSARSVLTGTSWREATGDHVKKMDIPVNFISDVGRKKFGFSHEELDNATGWYEGGFKVGLRHGTGVMFNGQTGAKYVGQFQFDKFHGDGDQLWSDGSHYKGQWVSGQKHGVGSFEGADRLTYTGQWEGGRRHGQGTQEYANGDRYQGWWINGLCNGIGKYYFADGSTYEGMWSNGRYDGVGTLIGSDGTRERQTYHMGLLIQREVLSANTNTSRGARFSAIVGSKVLYGQTRDETHKATIMKRPQVSQYLIRRETAGLDLTAPPLLPKTAPAGMSRLPRLAESSSAGGGDGRGGGPGQGSDGEGRSRGGAGSLGPPPPLSSLLGGRGGSSTGDRPATARDVQHLGL